MGSARLESLNGRGRKRRRGKRPLARSGEQPLRPPWSNPSPPPLQTPLPPPRELSRERRDVSPLRPSGCCSGHSRSGHLGSPGPRPASRLQPPGQSRPVRRVGEPWQSAPSCFSAVRKDVGFFCQGPIL